MRRVAVSLGGIVLLLAILVGGAALLAERLSGPALCNRLVAALHRQTGQETTIGSARVRLLPWPGVRVTQLAIGDLLRVRRLDAGIALWPLLHHALRLDPMRLEGVAVHLVREANGRANWQAAAHPTPDPQSTGTGSIGGVRGRWTVAFDRVAIDEADLSLTDAVLHRAGTAHLRHLAASGFAGERPHFSLTGDAGGAVYQLDGETGPWRPLLAPRRPAAPAWPLSWPLSLRGSETVSGVVVGHGRVAGAIADPISMRGYDLAGELTMTRLEALNRLFPDAGVPPVRDLEASARVRDANGPVLVALRAGAGATALPRAGAQALAGELMVQSWSLAAPTPQAPIALALGGSWHGQALVLKGQAGSLRALQDWLAARPGAAAPVALTAGLGGGAWRIDGVVGANTSDLRLQGRLPDPRLLWAAAPDLGATTLAARLRAEAGTLFRLSEIHVVSAAGDLDGALALSLDRRATLSGQLHSTRIDADRLAPNASRESPSPAAGPGQVVSPRSPSRQGPSQPALPWAMLRLADLDLAYGADQLRAGGQAWSGLRTHLLLRDGRLTVGPLRANGLAGRIEADADASPPTLHLWLHPLTLPAALFGRLTGMAPIVGGNIELAGEMRAAGNEAAALRATASGHGGLSMTDGTISNAALAGLLGRASPIGALLPAAGGAGLRCLAVHATMAAGKARLDTLTLRTTRLTLDGQGDVGLGDGALDLHLLAHLLLGGASVALPVHLAGSVHDPHAALDTALTGGRSTLTIGGAAAGGADAAASCEAPLRAAREGLPGPAPALLTGTAGKRPAPKPIDILRGLGWLH